MSRAQSIFSGGKVSTGRKHTPAGQAPPRTREGCVSGTEHGTVFDHVIGSGASLLRESLQCHDQSTPFLLTGEQERSRMEACSNGNTLFAGSTQVVIRTNPQATRLLPTK